MDGVATTVLRGIGELGGFMKGGLAILLIRHLIVATIASPTILTGVHSSLTEMKTVCFVLIVTLMEITMTLLVDQTSSGIDSVGEDVVLCMLT